jgi:hypothetical protein
LRPIYILVSRTGARRRVVRRNIPLRWFLKACDGAVFRDALSGEVELVGPGNSGV